MIAFIALYWWVPFACLWVAYFCYRHWQQSQPKDLPIMDTRTGAGFTMPAHYSSEGVASLLAFLDQQDKDVAHRNQYLPDETYLPTPSEYERHYFMLVREIEQTLGPFFGAMPGPHPQVCHQCNEHGKCVCGAPYLWIDAPEELLYLAAEKLKTCTQHIST